MMSYDLFAFTFMYFVLKTIQTVSICSYLIPPSQYNPIVKPDVIGTSCGKYVLLCRRAKTFMICQMEFVKLCFLLKRQEIAVEVRFADNILRSAWAIKINHNLYLCLNLQKRPFS